jgi:uncharacterized ion transporter superfamily protein YfcC
MTPEGSGVREKTTSFWARIKIPDPMVLIFGVLVMSAIVTHILPSGSFEREEIAGQTRVIPGSYHAVQGEAASLFDIFLAVPKGLLEASQYLFIVFIAGGLFNVLSSTGALENLVGTIVRKVGLKNRAVIIWITTFVFGFFGVAVGFENNIALVPIAMLVARAIGGSNLVGASMAVGGIGVGFALSPINPYTVGVSQQIADLPMFSGAPVRATLVSLSLCIVAWYSVRALETNPASDDDDDGTGLSKPIEEYTLVAKDWKVLIIFVAGLAYMLYGVFTEDWYINEIAATFLAIAIFVGFACRIPGDDFVKIMMDGASSVTAGALIIGLAASIQIVLEEGMIIDTVIQGLAGVLSSLPVPLAAVMTTVVQGILNFFIPSGSGQAMVTMPILIPLGDLIGITRQTMVLAFQVGDGLTNLIVPTSGGTLAMLAMAKVSYSSWLRFCLPLMLGIYMLSWGFIVGAVLLGWQ